MRRVRNDVTRRWLQTAELEALCEKFPALWQEVEREIAVLLESGDESKLQSLTSARAKNDLESFAKERMTMLAVKRCCLRIASGVKEGKIRFNWLNGFVAQKLLFAQKLERKPVSLFLFRLLWPLVWQRRRLMPLVESKGIYCFYSKKLVLALADLIGQRSCLEIAAGDGTLTRFLREEGIEAVATDSKSWKDINYPDWVEKLDAVTALQRYSPEVVVSSWPPAGNDFERQVFRTPSVELYIMIGSRHRFASGNWEDYQRQTAFTFDEDARLGPLVLPPELAAAVYVFRRRVSDA